MMIFQGVRHPMSCIAACIPPKRGVCGSHACASSDNPLREDVFGAFGAVDFGGKCPLRNSGLLHVGTRGRQHKSAERKWLVSGPEDHRYGTFLSHTVRHEDAGGLDTGVCKAATVAQDRETPGPPPPQVQCKGGDCPGGGGGGSEFSLKRGGGGRRP